MKFGEGSYTVDSLGLVQVTDRCCKMFITICFTAVECGLPQAIVVGPKCATKPTPENMSYHALCSALDAYICMAASRP
jgi:hypothetical protein